MSQHGFRVLIPVQRLDAALPRMKVAGPQRRDLALAFARDTVDAALRCSQVSEVVVITEDPSVAEAFVGLGATVRRPGERHSIESAVMAAYRDFDERDARPTAVLMGDLPALMSAELGSALRRVPETARGVYCQDMLAGGTTFFAGRRGAFSPALGPRSAARNASAGAMRIGNDLPGLRRDVDTFEDLKLAKDLGVGMRTSQLLARYRRLRPARLTA